MVARHERLARAVDQPRAFAAQRFGNQEPRRAGQVERGRMELHELEIGDARAGVIGERDAVAGRHRADWSFRGTPDRRRRSPAASRGARTSCGRPSRSKNRTPQRRAVLDDQIGDQRVVDGLDRRQRRRPAPRARGRSRGRSRRRRAGRGGRCAPPRGRAPARPSASRSKPRAPVDQLADVARALLDQHAHRRLVAQAVAGANACPRRAAPGCRRRRSPRRCRPARSRCCSRSASALVRISDAAARRERDRGAQAGDAAADDEEVSDVGGQRARCYPTHSRFASSARRRPASLSAVGQRVRASTES